MGNVDASPLGNTMRAMSLKSWLSQESGRGRKLAAHLKVPPSFVSKMASGERPVPTEHGAAIELFTGGAFSRRDYWPESWVRIWPEMQQGDAERLATDHGSDVAQPATAPTAQGVVHA